MSPLLPLAGAWTTLGLRALARWPSGRLTEDFRKLGVRIFGRNMPCSAAFLGVNVEMLWIMRPHSESGLKDMKLQFHQSYLWQGPERYAKPQNHITVQCHIMHDAKLVVNVEMLWIICSRLRSLHNILGVMALTVTLQFHFQSWSWTMCKCCGLLALI